MRWLLFVLSILLSCWSTAQQATTDGIVDLVRRRLPDHADAFRFELVEQKDATGTENDRYSISTQDGKILVQGNSVSALAVGLRRYLTDHAHVDIYWFIGSRLHLAPTALPNLTSPLTGTSIVPWRYHFNTVTFSYTTAFWTWDDWEVQLDWMALHGINLPLAWVGQEKILIDVLHEYNFNDTEIVDFLSGPAFQAWNRFGNIQSDWAGSLPQPWVDGQFGLQKKIVARMVELGMTPILPAFTGFVPRTINRIYPNASILIGSRWNQFETQYTNVTFLPPSDNYDLFTGMQKSFISRQQGAYGNVTTLYTLDQYNENHPQSGSLDFLGNLSESTWRSFKEADPAATWVIQAWLFTASPDFWTFDRIQAYLDGVPNEDMLILDLWSESAPQWQRSNSYFGKPWIWCQLHDYGGSMGFYGQIMNLTLDPVEALEQSSSLVGFGLSMEAQEGNQIVYDLLLDQAWSETAIDTDSYFYNWVSSRYGPRAVPSQLYEAWDILRTTAYNNTNVTFDISISVPAVRKSIIELVPSWVGMTNRTGGIGTTIAYHQSTLVEVWNLFFNATTSEPALWDEASFQFDFVDVSRQVLSNSFNAYYDELISSYNTTGRSPALVASSTRLLDLLKSLDAVLSTNKHFRLDTWIDSALAWSNSSDLDPYFEYNARNQITLWGPNGEIADYASKSWAGLVSSYYLPRWQLFLGYLNQTSPDQYNQTQFSHDILRPFELQWQTARSFPNVPGGDLRTVLGQVQKQWPDIFDQ